MFAEFLERRNGYDGIVEYCPFRIDEDGHVEVITGLTYIQFLPPDASVVGKFDWNEKGEIVVGFYRTPKVASELPKRKLSTSLRSIMERWLNLVVYSLRKRQG